MLTDFHIFPVVFSSKFATKSMSYISPPLKVLLHYLAKHKGPKLAKFCCTKRNKSCLMLTKTSKINMMSKIKYALYRVKLNAQNFIHSHIDDTAQNHVRHQSNAASVHRRHELGRPAGAFSPSVSSMTQVISGAWYVGIRVKVLNFDHLICATSLSVYMAVAISAKTLQFLQ